MSTSLGPARGKTTPASTGGSFKTHAHAAGDVDLIDDSGAAAGTSREEGRRRYEQVRDQIALVLEEPDAYSDADLVRTAGHIRAALASTHGTFEIRGDGTCIDPNARLAHEIGEHAYLVGKYGSPSGRAILVDHLRAGLERADSSVRLYDGKGADEWRERASAGRRAREESWERSDTDGFMSQWASDVMANKYDACARLAEAGGKAEFPALFDTEGRLVDARLVQTRYGTAWCIANPTDPDGKPTWINQSTAKKAERRNAFYAARGYAVGTVRRQARVLMSEGMAPSPYFAPASFDFDPHAEIVTREQTEDWG